MQFAALTVGHLSSPFPASRDWVKGPTKRDYSSKSGHWQQLTGLIYESVPRNCVVNSPFEMAGRLGDVAQPDHHVLCPGVSR